MATVVTTTLAARQALTLAYPAFTGTEEQCMSLPRAAEVTHNYRATYGPERVKGGYFGRVIIERILGQEKAVGIRVYFAHHHNATPTFVLTGVEEGGNDLYEGVLAQYIFLCPPYCGATNPLNSDTTVISRRKDQLQMFTGNESHNVSLAEATDLIQNYTDLANASGVKGCYFSRRVLSTILAQPSSVGIRYYLAAEATGRLTLVAVGVEQDGTDLVRGVLGEGQAFGPSDCGALNPLNR